MLQGRGSSNCDGSVLPALDVVLHFATWHYFSAVVSERTRHTQLIQQLVHQQAGLPAALQHEWRATHGTKVALQQKAGETLLAVGMSTGRVQGPDERLQADVTDEVVVHLIFVEVLVVLLQQVAVATCCTKARGRTQQSIV